MKKVKDSLASKLVKMLRPEIKDPANEQQKLAKYKNVVFSMKYTLAKTYELGVYVDGKKSSYTPIKEFNSFSPIDVEAALESYFVKNSIADSLQEVVQFNCEHSINAIARALEHEFASWWTYDAVADSLTGNGASEVSTLFKRHADDEQYHHTRKLKERLETLGGRVSSISVNASVGLPDVLFQLAFHIYEEVNSISLYEELINHLCSQSSQDVVTINLFKEILSDEQDHAAALLKEFECLRGVVQTFEGAIKFYEECQSSAVVSDSSDLDELWDGNVVDYNGHALYLDYNNKLLVDGSDSGIDTEQSKEQVVQSIVANYGKVTDSAESIMPCVQELLETGKASYYGRELKLDDDIVYVDGVIVTDLEIATTERSLAMLLDAYFRNHGTITDSVEVNGIKLNKGNMVWIDNGESEEVAAEFLELLNPEAVNVRIPEFGFKVIKPSQVVEKMAKSRKYSKPNRKPNFEHWKAKLNTLLEELSSVNSEMENDPAVQSNHDNSKVFKKYAAKQNRIFKKIEEARAKLGIADSRIQDLAEDEQTDALKEELYKLVQQFVWKYWRQYYPAFKGETTDLIIDFYENFLTKKGRGEKKESLLDKYDTSITSLPYLVKTSVIRMLIDRSRSDKHEVNYSEQYDEETGDLSLDFLASLVDEEPEYIDSMVFTPEQVEEIKSTYEALPEAAKKHFLRMYRECRTALAPNFQELFSQVVGF